MARKRERAFAGFFAVLFLLSASATTIAVIYQMVQNHQSQSAQAKLKCTPSLTQTGAQVGKLQGNKLTNFTPTDSIPQLKEIDTKPGTGDAVAAGATVTVDYTGAVACDGIIFQSSLDSGKPVSFPLTQVIPGWTQGIPGMKVGGTRRLLIPAALAYGANPPQGSGIPANADLVFDVTLHGIAK